MDTGILAALWQLIGQPSPIATLLWAVLAGIAVKLCTDPLRHVPGPLVARLTPLWLWYVAWRGTECRSVAALHARYGPAVRVAPREVDLADGAAAHAVYVRSGGLLKSPAYRNFDIDGFATLFSAVDPAHRAPRAKAVAPMFAQQAVVKGKPAVMRVVDEAVAELARRRDGARGRPVDLLSLFRSLALNASSSYLFGEPFGSVRDPKLEATAFVNDFVAVGSLYYMPAWIYGPVSRLSAWLSSNKSEVTASTAAVEEFVNRITDNSMAEEKDEATTYQGRLLKTGISREETLAQVKDLIFAGTDATGMNMSMLCFYLRKCPDKYEKARKEILENPSIDAQSLPYLTGVVKETLRLSMANPSRLPRTVPPSGLQIDGLPALPGGARVGLSAYMLHRNPAVFPEPGAFQPERWLQPPPTEPSSSASLQTEMLRDSFYFGAGPRQCIARNLASAEIAWLAHAVIRSGVLDGAEPVEDKIEIREWFNSSVVSGKIELVWP
ncbi:cytochrome P450 [Hypoxylon sp. FL1284]|nr:cytochrome P450 [Hypoxylon sp. FL1284]